MTLSLLNEVTDNYTFRYKTPDGTAIIIITDEAHPTVQILIGKTGSSIAAWAAGFSGLLTYALESRPIEDVVTLLADITTDKVAFHRGVECRSTPEAVSFALLEYSRILQKKKFKKGA